MRGYDEMGKEYVVHSVDVINKVKKDKFERKMKKRRVVLSWTIGVILWIGCITYGVYEWNNAQHKQEIERMNK